VPIASARRSRGVTATTHASAPAQIAAAPMPCSSRAATSAPGLTAKPKATLATASSASAPSTVRLGPIRDASHAAGSDSANVPAA
jgi:hypothetical protein